MNQPVRAELKNLESSLDRPVMLATIPAVLTAVVYDALSFSSTATSNPFFLVLAAIIAASAVGLGLAYRKRGTETLRALGKGSLAPTVENLKQAVRETRAYPDRVFKSTLFLWFSACVGFGVGAWAVIPAVSAGTGFHIAWVAVLVAPISAVLSHVLVLIKSREVVETLLASGLTTADLIAAAPAKRTELRRRLILLLAITMLTPAILVADLTIRRTSDAVHDVLAQQGHATAEQLKAQSARNLLPVRIFSGLMVLYCLGVAIVAVRALVDPMRKLGEAASKIADGDVGELKVVPSEDEVWAASTAFSAMQRELRSLLEQLQRAGAQLSSGSGELVATSRSNEAGAAEQAASLNETSATTEELARSARQIAENAAAVAEIAQQTYSSAQSGQRSSEAFQASMARMREGNQAIADSVVKLNKRVQQIGKIIEFINEIADKSDLLALNAELEGTKAGEVGRGFSLVAAEMRRLAENVLTSTREIERLISEVRDATNAAVMATEAGVKATDSGAGLATRVSSNLQLILDLARQTSDSVRAISLATQQQQTGTDQLAAAMADILRVTEQSAQASRQLAAANNDLSSLSSEMTKVVSGFKLGTDA